MCARDRGRGERAVRSCDGAGGAGGRSCRWGKLIDFFLPAKRTAHCSAPRTQDRRRTKKRRPAPLCALRSALPLKYTSNYSSTTTTCSIVVGSGSGSVRSSALCAATSSLERRSLLSGSLRNSRRPEAEGALAGSGFLRSSRRPEAEGALAAPSCRASCTPSPSRARDENLPLSRERWR